MANEKRLIDANVMLHNMCERCNIENEDCPCEPADCFIYNVITNAPTVDAVEVVHGHWYKAPHHPYRCSCCGEMALLDMYGESHYRSNYCPNCGAKMDGGNEDG